MDNSIQASFLSEKFRQTTKSLLGNCRSKSGATKEDFETLRDRKIPTTKTGLCLMDCLFEGAGIMENGKFIRSGMVNSLTAAMKGDEAKIAKLNELGKVCEKELDYKQFPECQTGKKILECLARNGEKYGLEFVNTKTDK
ncbi:unnamed protein product [Diabrotica balteata]|uniref:Uncharacterized protein n=1 Tax=Diabrotica balteata TaxID=107213 RepID=A0A9N9SQQ1_DIABA|nr:unnamed protein product [Diabrotica balteata]